MEAMRVLKQSRHPQALRTQRNQSLPSQHWRWQPWTKAERTRRRLCSFHQKMSSSKMVRSNNVLSLTLIFLIFFYVYIWFWLAFVKSKYFKTYIKIFSNYPKQEYIWNSSPKIRTFFEYWQSLIWVCDNFNLYKRIFQWIDLVKNIFLFKNCRLYRNSKYISIIYQHFLMFITKKPFLL